VTIEPPSRQNPDFIPTGDRTFAVSDSQAVSAAKNVMATAAFSMVKDQVSLFAEKSQAVMKVLDEVGKLHPFIQGMSEPISLHEKRKSDRTFIYILSCCNLVQYGYQDGINSTRK